jgi:heterodisulfide reductase subunit C
MINVKGVMEQEAAIPSGTRFPMTDEDARSTCCYSCGICTSSCPVALGPGGLDPRRIVHLANLGNLDLDRAGRSIWHCLDCRRCSNLCPNSVSPWSLIASLRWEARQEGWVSGETWDRLQQLKQELVAVLSNTLALPLSPGYDEISQEWDRWAREPEMPSISPNSIKLHPRKRSLSHPMNQALCLTCRECSSACPLCVTTARFDPLYFIRCYALGLSPGRASLWSCLQCGSCSQACSQSVQGHLVVKALQEEQETYFRIPFQGRIHTTRERVFQVYASRVDALLDGTI